MADLSLFTIFVPDAFFGGVALWQKMLKCLLCLLCMSCLILEPNNLLVASNQTNAPSKLGCMVYVANSCLSSCKLTSFLDLFRYSECFFSVESEKTSRSRAITWSEAKMNSINKRISRSHTQIVYVFRQC